MPFHPKGGLPTVTSYHGATESKGIHHRRGGLSSRAAGVAARVCLCMASYVPAVRMHGCGCAVQGGEHVDHWAYHLKRCHSGHALAAVHAERAGSQCPARGARSFTAVKRWPLQDEMVGCAVHSDLPECGRSSLRVRSGIGVACLYVSATWLLAECRFERPSCPCAGRAAGPRTIR